MPMRCARNHRLHTDAGKEYRLDDKTAGLIVRPRCWHLPEKHLLVDASGLRVDLRLCAVFLSTTHRNCSHEDRRHISIAERWESISKPGCGTTIFVMAQDELRNSAGHDQGDVPDRDLLAAFEMDEILYELREHSAGLNAGRWDYIFSRDQETARQQGFSALPTRQHHDAPRLSCAPTAAAGEDLSPARRVRHGRHVRRRSRSRTTRRPTMRQGSRPRRQQREATDGYDGTWVAHPGLVEIDKGRVRRSHEAPNQVAAGATMSTFSASDLLKFRARSAITENGSG
jgi:malate synthase